MKTSGESFALRMSGDAPGLDAPATVSQTRGRLGKLKVKLSALGREIRTVELLSADVLRLVIELHEGWAWKALGDKPWPEFIEDEALHLPKLLRADELNAVEVLLKGHLSYRDAGVVLGLSKDTVRARKIALEAEGVVFPEFVRSGDGKVRPVTIGAAPVVMDVLPGQLSLPVDDGLAVSATDVQAFLQGLDEHEPDLGLAVVLTLSAFQSVGPAVEQIEISAAEVSEVSARNRSGIREVVRSAEEYLRRVKSVAHSVGVTA